MATRISKGMEINNAVLQERGEGGEEDVLKYNSWGGRDEDICSLLMR
jgi:hypothetical protein